MRLNDKYHNARKNMNKSRSMRVYKKWKSKSDIYGFKTINVIMLNLADVWKAAFSIFDEVPLDQGKER